MKIEVDITDQVDELVRQDLEEHALYLLKEGNDKHELIMRKAQLFSAFCTVVEYYSTRDQFKCFLNKTKGKRVE